MARRRRSQNATIPPVLLGPLILIGLIFWLFKTVQEQVPSDAMIAIGLIVVGVPALIIIVRSMRRRAEQRSMFERRIIAEHLPSLLQRRLQLLGYDAYGKPQVEGWAKEVNYFIGTQLAPALNEGEGAATGSQP